MIDYSVLDFGAIAVLGMPFDDNSSFMAGPANAPKAIRQALRSASSNMCTEDGRDLSKSRAWLDLGDLPSEIGGKAFQSIEESIRQIVSAGARPLSLGGDHSITYPIIKGLASAHNRITILQLDAHPDLYDELDGNRLSHACPFARIMEEGLVDRLIQVGIRTMNMHQKAQADRFSVEVITAGAFEDGLRPEIDGPLYISLDMDVFDPAFAPGVSHHEPGGLSSRQIIRLLQSIECPLLGADIVELNPDRDPLGITSMLSAKLVKELISLMMTEVGDV